MPTLIPAGPEEVYDISHDLLTWLSDNFRRFGNVYRASIYGCNVYVVSDPALAQHVLRDNWQNYKKGMAIKRVALLLGNGLMVSEGEFWKTQRRMIQPAFLQNAMGGLIDVITAANLALREKWQRAAETNQAVNITQDISATILEIVLKVLFGNDYPRIATHFALVASEQARDLQFARTFRAAREIIFDMIAQRRQGRLNGTDILGMMLAARDRSSHQPMRDNQVVNEIMTLIVAGHETTASTLNWTWYLLAKHPDAQQRLAAEVRGNRLATAQDLTRFHYVRQVLEEAMRLYPPGWLVTRRALHDDHIGDYFVPAGTEVYIAPYLIQRNPAFWDAPETFDPGRFDPNHGGDRHELAMLPFSAGPRNCIGEHLARLEMQLHLMVITERLVLGYDSDVVPEIEAGVNLRSKHDFIMQPRIRATVSDAVEAR